MGLLAMSKRKRFCVIFLPCLLAALGAHAAYAKPHEAKVLTTSSLRVVMDPSRPRVVSLSVDSLKGHHFREDPLIDDSDDAATYVVTTGSNWIAYADARDPKASLWTIRSKGDALLVTSRFSAHSQRPLPVVFNPERVHATLLGHIATTGDTALPALLHLPGMGSLEVSTLAGNNQANLQYEAHRSPRRFVKVTFPAASRDLQQITYVLRPTAIHPVLSPNESQDKMYDGFRRDYLDAFQMQAGLHVLANNSASDPCPFVLYFYADMAVYLPPLTKGLTAMDLVRETLDHYLDGFKGYGMPGYQLYDSAEHTAQRYTLLDVYPSLLISAYDYVSSTGDDRWLAAHYDQLRSWAEEMNKAGRANGSTLLQYALSGNSGSWPAKTDQRPANWWDTIGFGHFDAYSNALGFRAYRSMASLASRLKKEDDAKRYALLAEEIKSQFYATFYNPDTGVLAGWKSQDGQLHDYYFTFVNGIAVRYGLVNEEISAKLMNRMWTKMKSVGFDDFSLGIPGNLEPIADADYVDKNPRYGGSKEPDGSDGFQIYENGGATSCFAYFTIGALYRVGEKDKADLLLRAMLRAFSHQGFSGFGPDGMSYDWKDWNGNPHGYEGFLVDNYYTFLAVLDRDGRTVPIP